MTNFVCNNMNGKQVIILLDIEVLASGEEVGSKIGNPDVIGPDGKVNKTNSASASAAPASGKRPASEKLNEPTAKRSPLTSKDNKPTPGKYGGGMASSQAINPSNVTVFPIASLTPYQNRWTIKAR